MRKTSTRRRKLLRIYEKLFARFGPQHWWPGETPFEVAVGAILTQNTNWSNVEKAIANLKRAGLMSASKLHKVPRKRLAALIRPSGYFNVKAERLHAFVDYLVRRYRGSLKIMGREDTMTLRHELLAIKGIGPETADSILLYALGRPVFVIDAYTKRVLSSHGILDVGETYGAYQECFHACFPPDGPDVAEFYNEFHALFVMAGKTYCRPRNPRCPECPLKE